MIQVDIMTIEASEFIEPMEFRSLKELTEELELLSPGFEFHPGDTVYLILDDGSEFNIDCTKEGWSYYEWLDDLLDLEVDPDNIESGPEIGPFDTIEIAIEDLLAKKNYSASNS